MEVSPIRDSSLEEKINELMAKGFEIPPEKLVPSASLVADLKLDSLDAVDMLVYIEDQFGIKVEGERLTQLKTLEDVYKLAREAVQKSNIQVS